MTPRQTCPERASRRGTEGSNPASSTAESIANLTCVHGTAAAARSTKLGRDIPGGRGAGGESLYAPAPSFAGFGEALVSEPRFADPPRASRPQPEAVEVEIDDGRRV